MAMIENNALLAVSPLPRLEIIRTYYIITSAYNPVPEQTDDTPFITASGEMVKEGIIAVNWLPFGSLLRINGEIYEVKDRMNSKYGYPYVDIFMWEVDEAIEFGRQKLKVELVN